MDIDTDIATSLRPYLIAYLKWRYGEKSVCSIVTENMYGAKGALKLAGRDRADQLFGHLPIALASEEKKKYNCDNTYVLADMIPEGAGETLAAHDEEFAKKYGMDTEKCIIWNHAKLVEGKLFTTGVHAGGIIISDNDNINEYVPLAWNDEKGVWVAQCDMIQAEEKGLLKMDLLGLSTLDCISDTLHLIKRYRGIDINIDNIEFEPEVFEYIYSEGLTNSVFQFESAGMKSMLTQFRPTRFEDLILLVAAYRPGPMQYLNDIIAVKNGNKDLTFHHEMLRPLLSKTYGATIYQEQVMQIFQDLAGFSLGAADLVRRAMSKKKLEKLEHERIAFIQGDSARNIDGCINRGISEQTANQLFDEMMDFARYAFNKSHAAAYAYVSYQTAWLKHHYPVEFLCAMFNNKDQKDYGQLLDDCRTLGINLLPPDINASFYDFVVEGDSIRFGCRGIKGIGDAVQPLIHLICENREQQAYRSVQDFLKRNIIIDQDIASILPHNVLSAMINVGMFDTMGYNRLSLDEAFNKKITVKRVKNKSSDPLPDHEMRKIICEMIDQVEWLDEPQSEEYNMQQELSLLGSIVRSHPLDRYASEEVYGCLKIDEMEDKNNASILGFISSITERQSKSGKDMIVLSIKGKTGFCTGYITGKSVQYYKDRMKTFLYKVVRITGNCKEGKTIFISSINFISPDIRPMFILPRSIDEVHNIISQKQDIGYIPVYTLHSWNKKGTQYSTKVSSKTTFSQNEMEQLKLITDVRDDIY